LACRQSPSRRHYCCAKITAFGLISLGTSYTSDYRVFSLCLDSLTAADSTFAFYLLHPAQRPAPERCVAPGLGQAAYDGATHRFGRRGRVLTWPMVTAEKSQLISFMSPISGFWFAIIVRWHGHLHQKEDFGRSAGNDCISLHVSAAMDMPAATKPDYPALVRTDFYAYMYPGTMDRLGTHRGCAPVSLPYTISILQSVSLDVHNDMNHRLHLPLCSPLVPVTWVLSLYRSLTIILRRNQNFRLLSGLLHCTSASLATRIAFS
jgi:hypothetical protein